MRVLLTGAGSPLGQEIAAALDSAIALRRLDDCSLVDGRGEWVEASLVDAAAMGRALQGIDAVIHTGEPPPVLPQVPQDEMLLDLATRGTHVLFKAAIDAGVKRLVYASTLEIFADYPDTVHITEMYRPYPTAEPAPMAKFLGELVTREFARDFQVTVTALRLGKLVWQEEVVDRERDLMWVDIRDAVQAFCGALERDESASLNWVSRFAIFHICAPIANPKFLIGRAAAIGYAPTRNFA